MLKSNFMKNKEEFIYLYKQLGSHIILNFPIRQKFHENVWSRTWLF